jgi:UDP-glucose 4-epimerase
MSRSKPIILVTGGSGYIGSHTVLALKQAGYDIIILDNLVYGHQDLVDDVLNVKLIIGDTTDRALLDEVFATYDVEAVMHFAAYTFVGESAVNPAKYYRSNVVGTLTLLEAMLAASVKKFVFSSTCAIYGPPTVVPIPEDHPKNPISVYGMTKLIAEQILSDFVASYDFKAVCFRYFNAAGADPEGRLGEDHTPETHLIPIALLVALGVRDALTMFGSDYPTPDGTCIRDYIHVSDLANAHILGLNYLLNGGDSLTLNLGSGTGFSVKQVIKMTEQIAGRNIKVIECDRRPGDPPILVGSSEQATRILGWKAQYPDLEQIIAHAWQWHQKRHGQK